MRAVHDYVSTTPFDIYELHLFHLVAKHRSFTKAAQVAGLTQSAVTRQMQGMENSLGVSLLERTTRSVRMTPAGEFLFGESIRLLGDVEQSLRRMREEFGNARKEVRVGVSRTIGLAYLPGFFHANLRRLPEVGYRVVYESSARILSALEGNELDLGVLCPPNRLPRTLGVTHMFKDAFTLVGSSAAGEDFRAAAASKKARQAWLDRQSWLLIEESTQTGQHLRRWMAEQGLRSEPIMQLDSFDLIINLVALNMGVSFVPIRALALYRSKRTLVRLPLPARFVRELVVVVRKHRKMPEHLIRFVENVLF
jgi:DNA-binding transcriptional LysR family regulator